MNERLFSLRNRWFAASAGALVLAVLLAAFVGFVLLPRAHARTAMASVWESICSAAGAPARYPSPALPEAPTARPTDVIVANLTIAPPDAAAVGRGATLALQCSMCHGARGTASAGIGAPHLAGQPASATYKQLRDFKSGRRANDINRQMRNVAHALTDDEIVVVARYYAAR